MPETNEPLAVLGARELAAARPGARPERDRRLTRVRRGVYAVEPAGQPTREARYLLRIQAVHVSRVRPVFARESALAIHGIPYGLEPECVYTTGGARTAGRKSGVVHAPAPLGERDIVAVGDLRVCSLAYALADVARRADALTAVSAIDQALRLERVTKDEVLEALARQSKRGRARAEWAIAFADAAAESVGESWSRVRIFQLGFAAPALQVWVTGRSGKRYRVDMCWRLIDRRPVYGEFDGLQKYGELAHQSGATGAQALAKEKARDDDLLFSGDPAHWIWADVMSPERLDRILTAYGIPRVRRPLLAL
ncbi:hypothetical protein [Agrococcus carbonis]|uniref:Transcriptional regulator, AbiEi antitoxin, Type IV TA system n=1 Tax=Agrococcus carbonis TaxID=684552 RepID=A0A1H1RKZ1_9MICO|nr:hypothetical protein [Agrococcus carbonis]SDS36358.1 Transcriptional regulator, AbiEi antitoxin, Type IV TA system [Agrococcus carbonis]